ncbi:MAG: NlpC/P60 family protein [Roseburia sp.]|nr:NlpC/P60 family protein [Roseburia sp.]MCM1097837.1 NlpC/P60 family protein [Ruminococcus flavefaciens]
MNFILAAGLTFATVASAVPKPMTAEATSIGQVQENIRQHQEELERWQEQVASLEDEQDLIEEQIADLNAEIINIMASIGVLEEEIAQKEEEITRKAEQIEETQAEYDEAVIREENQRQSMIECTRMIYENNDVSYLKAFLEGKGLADVLNQMDYMERIYEYSMNRLNEFIETKEQVHALWDQLEEEKAGLDQDKTGLEADSAVMEGLKADLNGKLAKKRRESANYDAEIKKAQQEAAVAKKLLQQDQQKLKQLQAAQKAASITISTTSYTALIDSATGSEQGKRIAKYACQFVGNPYVAGGTSLTQGADCSGFTYRIYQDFGYSIPRTSTQQRSAGTAVAYENAQPGDLICYDGHVAMYIGGGMIVHASSAKTGIKISQAQYRTILAVRRIV